MPFRRKRPKVFYMHVAKAGGTSVNSFFRKRLGKRRCLNHIEGKRLDPGEVRRRFDFVSGHMRIRQIYPLLGLDDWYRITVFRDPLQHIVSHLRWVQGIASDPGAAFFKSHTPEVQELALQLREVDIGDARAMWDFFANLPPEGFTLFDNCQSRYLLSDPPSGKLGSRHWPEAQEGLSLFHRIGLTSDLQGFIDRVAGDLQLRSIAKMPRENVQQGPKPEMSQEVLEVLAPYLEFDRRLVACVEGRTTSGEGHGASRAGFENLGSQ